MATPQGEECAPQPLNGLGPIVESSPTWLYREVTMKNGDTGPHYAKTRGELENLQKALDSGEAFPYRKIPRREGGYRIQIRFSVPEAATGEGIRTSDNYWASKFELDKEETARRAARDKKNDSQIQLQFYQRLAADIILPTKVKGAKPEQTAQEILTLAEAMCNHYTTEKHEAFRVHGGEPSDPIQRD